jgi:putative SOS response-associated peptidase YedK
VGFLSCSSFAVGNNRGGLDWSPRYNITPTQSVPVIRQHPREPVRQILTMRWGLISHCMGQRTRLLRQVEIMTDRPYSDGK